MNRLIENIISKFRFIKIMIKYIIKNDQPTYPTGRDPCSLVNRLVSFNLYNIIYYNILLKNLLKYLII